MPQDILDRATPEIVTGAPTDPNAFLQWAALRPREEGRYELSRGVVTRDMSNVTRNHNRITTNILQTLLPQLDRDRYEIGSSDFAVRTLVGVRGPDVLVAEAVPDPKALAADVPLFLVEVLSPSSERIDRTVKRAEYTALPSLLAYLICSQDEPRAWLLNREPGGSWPDQMTELAGREPVIVLPALGITLPMSDIYRRI